MDEPIISVTDVGIRFSTGRRQRSARDMLIRGSRGRRDVDTFWALRGVRRGRRRDDRTGRRQRPGQVDPAQADRGRLLPDAGRVEVRDGVAPLIEITGGFVGDLSVRENIRLAAGLHGMDKTTIDANFDEIVDFAEIREFVHTPYKHLSSGMKVRVAFAVVSRLDEPILLVDEVLAVGDAAFRKKCYARIEEMLARGTTLFLVSHNEADLRRFCTRGSTWPRENCWRTARWTPCSSGTAPTAASTDGRSAPIGAGPVRRWHGLVRRGGRRWSPPSSVFSSIPLVSRSARC